MSTADETLFGIPILRNPALISENKDLLGKYGLKEEEIKKHHFKSHQDTHEGLLLEVRYGIYPHFYNFYPLEKESRYALSPIRFPLEEGGFGCEGAFVGCIREESKHKEEAVTLLRSLQKPTRKV